MALIGLLTFAFKAGVVFFLIATFIGLIIKKRNDSILRNIKNVMKDAKLNAKKYKLKNLYVMTEDMGNAVRIGRIKGFVQVEIKQSKQSDDKKDKKEQVKRKESYSLFLVKINIFGDKVIYRIETRKHTDIKNGGDVTLNEWNFINRDNFYVPNVNPIVESDKVDEYSLRGVNSIDRIKPLLQSAILLDSNYKKQDRMFRLIKEPDEV